MIKKLTEVKVEVEGPGYRRMKARLGPERLEALRLDTLRLQQEALSGVRVAKPPKPGADRESYKGYPKPRGKKRGRT